MVYKFSVLKSSWGIVVLMDMTEVFDPAILPADHEVGAGIYLRININTRIANDRIVYWFSKAILCVEDKLRVACQGRTGVCFNLDGLEFAWTDFQEEALYCVMLGWLERRFGIEVPKVGISFNQAENRYVFELPG